MSFHYLKEFRELADREYSTESEEKLADALSTALDDIGHLRAQLDNLSDNLADIANAVKDAQKEVA